MMAPPDRPSGATGPTQPGHPSPPAPDPSWAALGTALRGVALLHGADDEVLRELARSGLVHRIEAPRDTLLEAPPAMRGALCLVIAGQAAIGVFDPAALAARGRPQRDATLGEQDGTLLPPPPLARTARRNLALFESGELFNLDAITQLAGDDRVYAFALSRVVVLMIAGEAMRWLAGVAPRVAQALGEALAATSARLRSITGIRHELLDFYVRNGLSVAGPTVRLRQLDLCIDCKQCEEACEERHGAQRLTLGGYELGVLDFVYTCRTCSDARCLSPCEHDAIKRNAATGEITIHEDRCIGCSLCALSCPYGAISMVNVAEPELPSYNPALKARLDRAGKLAFGPGKGRKAQARRIASKCDHCAGYADQACVSACPTGSLIEISPATLFRERPQPSAPARGRRRLDVLPARPFLEGLAIRDSGAARVRTRKLSIAVWVVGLGAFLAMFTEVVLRWFQPTWSLSYRLMREAGVEPALAAMNVSYLAGSQLALTCGYLGTALMVLSMAYLLQRRFGWFYRTATNQFWLDVHLMTGIVGPLFIALHSALRLTTWVSIPFWSMTCVVISGVLGRYLYTLVPSLSSKHDLEILEHRRAITELATEYPAAGDHAYQVMDREAQRSASAWEIGLIPLLAWVLVDDARRVWTRRRDRRALARLAPRRIARQIARRIDRVVFYERRKELAPRGKALLLSWKRVHIPFSIVLLVTMIAHIAIALHVL
ncbi:MAG TPA: 4Fe-4S dicluster domain-containing protein [Kofleriaceae bacterium]|nr:4Fe-4S dicluster domain-containing protein [Kofleriaceae bacterium]